MPSIFTTEQVAGATFPGTQVGDTLLLFDDSAETNTGRLIIGTSSGSNINFELNSAGTIMRSTLSTHQHYVGDGGLRIGQVNMNADDVQKMKDIAQSKANIENLITEEAAAQNAVGKGKQFVTTTTTNATIGTLSVSSIILDGAELTHTNQDLVLNTLSVSGAVHTDASVTALSFEGNTATIANAIVTAALTVETGNTIIGSELSVEGATHLASTLSVHGAACADSLTISKDIVSSGTLSVGDGMVGTSLSLSGEVVGNLVSVSGDVHATTVFADRISVTNLELSLDDLSFTVPQDNLTVPRTLTVGKDVLVSETLSTHAARVETNLQVDGVATLNDVTIKGIATFDNPPTYETLTINTLNATNTNVDHGSFANLTTEQITVTNTIQSDSIVTNKLSVAGTGETDTLLTTFLSVNDSYVISEVIQNTLSTSSAVLINASISTGSALSLHGTTIVGTNIHAETLSASDATMTRAEVDTLSVHSGVVDGALSVGTLHTPLSLSSTFSNLNVLSNVDAQTLRGTDLSIGSLYVQEVVSTLSNLTVSSNLTVTKHLQFETASSPQLTSLQTTASVAHNLASNLLEGLTTFKDIQTAGMTASSTIKGTELSLSGNLNANFIYAKHVEADTIGGVNVSSLGEDEQGNFSVSCNLYVNNSMFVKELLSAGSVAIDNLTTKTMHTENALVTHSTLSCGTDAIVTGTLSTAHTIANALEVTGSAQLANATVATLQGAEIFNDFGSSEGKHITIDGTLHIDRVDGAILSTNTDNNSVRVLPDLFVEGLNTTVNNIFGTTAVFQDITGNNGTQLAMSKGAQIEGALSANAAFLGEVRLDTLRGRATNSQLNVSGPISVSQHIMLDGNIMAAGSLQGQKVSVSDTLLVKGPTTLEGDLTITKEGVEAIIGTLSVGTLYTEDGSGLMGMLSESLDLTGTLSVNAIDAVTLSVGSEHADSITVDTITVNTAMNLNGDFVTSAIVGSSGTITGHLTAGSISVPEITALEDANKSINNKFLGVESIVALDATQTLTCGSVLSVGSDAIFDGTISVSGGIHLKGALKGEAMISSSLSVQTLFADTTTIATPEADLNVINNLYVTNGYAQIANYLSVPTVHTNVVDTSTVVAAAMTAKNNLSVHGLATFSTLIQADHVEMNNLSVATSVHIDDSMYVANTINLGENGIVRTKALSLGSMLSVGGLVVNGQISTTGPIHVNGNLYTDHEYIHTALSVGTTITTSELSVATALVNDTLSVAEIHAHGFDALSVSSHLFTTTGATTVASLSVQGDMDVAGALSINGACHVNDTMSAANLSISTNAMVNGVLSVGTGVIENSMSIGTDLHVGGAIVSSDIASLTSATSQLRADIDLQTTTLTNVLNGSLAASDLSVENTIGVSTLTAAEINVGTLSVNDAIHTQFVYATRIQAEAIVGDVVATLVDGDPQSYVVPNDLFVENKAFVNTALSTKHLYSTTANLLSVYAPAIVSGELVTVNATVNGELNANSARIDNITIPLVNGPVLFDNEIGTSATISVAEALYTTTSDQVHVVGEAVMHNTLSIAGTAYIGETLVAPSLTIDTSISVPNAYVDTLHTNGTELKITSDVRTTNNLTTEGNVVVTTGVLSVPQSLMGVLSVSTLYVESEPIIPLPVESRFSNLLVFSNIVTNGDLSVGTIHTENIHTGLHGEITASNLNVSEVFVTEDLHIGDASIKSSLLGDTLIKSELSVFKIHVGSKATVFEDGVSANSTKLTGNFEVHGDIVTSGSLMVNGTNILDNIASSTIDTTATMIFDDSISVGKNIDLFNGGYFKGGLANEVIVYCNLKVANNVHALSDVFVGEGSDSYSITTRLSLLETVGGTSASTVLPADVDFDTVVIDSSLDVGGIDGITISTSVDKTQLVVEGNINVKGSILQNGAPYEVNSDQFLPLITPRLPMGFRQVFGNFRTGEITEDVGVILDIGYGMDWWNDENKVRVVESTIQYAELLPIKYDGSLDMDKIQNVEEPISYPFEANPSFSISLRGENGSIRNALFGVILGQTEPNNYFMFQDLDPNNNRFKENFSSTFEEYYGISEGFRVIRDSVYMAHESLHTQGTTFYTLQSIVTRDNLVKIDDLFIDWSATSTEGTSLTYVNETSKLYSYAIAMTPEERITSYYEKQGNAHVIVANSTKMYPSFTVRKWQNDGSKRIYITPIRAAIGWGHPPNLDAIFASQHANGQLRLLFNATYYYVYTGSTLLSDTGLAIFNAEYDLDSLYQSLVVDAADVGYNLEIIADNDISTAVRFRANIFPTLILSSSIDIASFVSVSRYSVTQLVVSFATIGTSITLYPITVQFTVSHSYVLEKYLTYDTSTYDETILSSLPIVTINTEPHEYETNLYTSTVNISNIHFIDDNTNASLTLNYQENASKRVRFVTNEVDVISQIIDPTTIDVSNIIIKDSRGATISN